MSNQRCIVCLVDTPDGSPAKCEKCQKRDKTFGYGSPVRFFPPGAPRKGTYGIDGDHDAYHGSSDPLDAE